MVYSYGLFDYRLFSRLQPGLSERGWSLVFVTHLLSVWLIARWRGQSCTLLRPSLRLSPAQPAEAATFDNSHEVRAGLISPRAARRFEQSAVRAMERTRRREKVEAVAQWNGLGLGGRVAAVFAQRHGLATLYLELGNISAKLFIDPEGVNAASLIARRPDLLDDYALSDADVEGWRSAFSAASRAAVAIPQAVRLKRINPWFPIDRFGALVLRIPRPIAIPLHRQVLTHLRLVLAPKTLAAQATPRDYVFLPLQVSTDTNLLLFSDYDNDAALDHAAGVAESIGVALVVKPHPAERDTRFLARMARRCAAAGHTWTRADTFDLLIGARRVVTINSTVGLIAKAFDRPVDILGRALYSHFTSRQAVAFAGRRLIDIDPYGNDTPPDKALDRIVALLAASRPLNLPVAPL